MIALIGVSFKILAAAVVAITAVKKLIWSHNSEVQPVRLLLGTVRVTGFGGKIMFGVLPREV